MSSGFRCRSTAAITARKRWVKVAHPTPWSPGSEVRILTITSRAPAGWVAMTCTSRMVTVLMVTVLMGYSFRPGPSIKSGMSY